MHIIYSDVNFSKLAQSSIYIMIVVILIGCQKINNSTVSDTPTSDIQITTSQYLTETPTPACVFLPDVKLDVLLLSDSSAQVKITGLKPNETVYTLLSSEFQEKERKIECCLSEVANENGMYEYSVKVRSQQEYAEFKDWQVQVFHSRGATCANFKFP